VGFPVPGEAAAKFATALTTRNQDLPLNHVGGTARPYLDRNCGVPLRSHRPGLPADRTTLSVL